jgi:2-amino-4-hydroxy-6-hydroxymethyldihydropteridine diphosphokinase
MKHIAYLSLGSNLGNREDHLGETIRRLSALGRIVALSSFYETEPVEVTDQEWFLNCALALETEVEPAVLLNNLLKLEKAMGRERIQKKGPRLIDIDIIIFGDAVVNTPELTIPHPAMAARRFVLQPLSEIAPNLQHPTLKKTIAELLSDLPEGQRVQRMQPPRSARSHTHKQARQDP